MEYLTLTKDNIKDEHICCAFSDGLMDEQRFLLSMESFTITGFETLITSLNIS